ncbi:hypothetical protein [Dermatophilus congolensis]|nr:hypothetical protein [Dermatophilus congolensis]MBO3132870.1 hypothetical protein [Dermatophilus congolensis]MBO3157665.1 hypothetical protein [Dermatophilus congolensis]MBO3189134.1 hypothetical protein [Dermatophilus congolensis]MBO3198119.1 hypothetical protein [Dermatophilus congolensis]MBO3202746.1 hypothetical protein [Dermatophilus congolensis]
MSTVIAVITVTMFMTVSAVRVGRVSVRPARLFRMLRDVAKLTPTNNEMMVTISKTKVTPVVNKKKRLISFQSLISLRATKAIVITGRPIATPGAAPLLMVAAIILILLCPCNRATANGLADCSDKPSVNTLRRRTIREALGATYPLNAYRSGSQLSEEGKSCAMYPCELKRLIRP